MIRSDKVLGYELVQLLNGRELEFKNMYLHHILALAVYCLFPAECGDSTIKNNIDLQVRLMYHKLPLNALKNVVGLDPQLV